MTSLFAGPIAHLHRYQVVYLDPPWRYANYGQAAHGAVRAHYPTMSVEDLLDLPVGDLADRQGCALLMWCTQTHSAEGVHARLMEAWGFRPVTKAFYWRKTYRKCACGHGEDEHDVAEDGAPGPCSLCWLAESADGAHAAAAIGSLYRRALAGTLCTRYQPRPYCGLGHYTRSGGEDCWLGLIGDGLTPDRHNVRQEVEAPVGKHSAKPAEVYERIEALWPAAERVELFARGAARAGWTTWGNDAEESADLFGEVA